MGYCILSNSFLNDANYCCQSLKVDANIYPRIDDMKKCFVIMPFGKQGTEEFDRNWKIYSEMIRPVLVECGYEPIRGDELEHFGSISRDIIESLYEADIVIADLSGKNVNVFYELGVRHALFRNGTIPIISQGQNPPFDISDYRAIAYSTEHDGPEKFKEALKRHVNAFESHNKKRADNPVHDFLGKKIARISPDMYNRIKRENVSLLQEQEIQSNERNNLVKRIKEMEQYISSLKYQLATRSSNDNDKSIGTATKTKNIYNLRKEPLGLSEEDITIMLKEYNFFESKLNTTGEDFPNNFEIKKFNGVRVVIDKTTNLMWQLYGSKSIVSLNKISIESWLETFNNNGYVGFRDWRIPTTTEAITLLKKEKNADDLHLHLLFEKDFWSKPLLTSDSFPYKSSGYNLPTPVSWALNFSKGCFEITYFGIIRPVRSI